MTEKKKVSFKKILGYLGIVAGSFFVGALVQKKVDVVGGVKNAGVKAYDFASSGIKKVFPPKAGVANVDVPVYDNAPRDNKFNN